MIIYSLVARGTLILAEYTSYDGDFPGLARKILAQTPKSKSKKTYTKDNYSFTLFSDNEFTFLCLNKSAVPREISYRFLDQLAELFFSEQRKQDDSRSWNAFFSGKIRLLIVNSTF
jgi:hypothetical protein